MSIVRLCVLFRELGYAGQTFKKLVGGTQFDIVLSVAGIDAGIGKGELVRQRQICAHEGGIGAQIFLTIKTRLLVLSSSRFSVLGLPKVT